MNKYITIRYSEETEVYVLRVDGVYRDAFNTLAAANDAKFRILYGKNWLQAEDGR